LQGLRRILDFANRDTEIVHVILYHANKRKSNELKLLFIVNNNENSVHDKLSNLRPIIEKETGKKFVYNIIAIKNLRKKFDIVRDFIENGIFLFSRKMAVRKKPIIKKYTLIYIGDFALGLNEILSLPEYDFALYLSEKVILVDNELKEIVLSELQERGVDFVAIDIWADQNDIDNIRGYVNLVA